VGIASDDLKPSTEFRIFLEELLYEAVCLFEPKRFLKAFTRRACQVLAVARP
jgi:hypothetical protein